MALREWPRRIGIKQDGYGPHNASIYDVDTGAILTRVFSLVVKRSASEVEVTMSKYDPDEHAFDHPDEPQEQGLTVQTRAYPIYQLHLEAGVK